MSTSSGSFLPESTSNLPNSSTPSISSASGDSACRRVLSDTKPLSFVFQETQECPDFARLHGPQSASRDQTEVCADRATSRMNRQRSPHGRGSMRPFMLQLLGEPRSCGVLTETPPTCPSASLRTAYAPRIPMPHSASLGIQSSPPSTPPIASTRPIRLGLPAPLRHILRASHFLHPTFESSSF